MSANHSDQGASEIGANALIHMHDVPAHTTVVGVPARVVKRDGERTDEALPVTRLPGDAIPVEPEASAR